MGKNQSLIFCHLVTIPGDLLYIQRIAVAPHLVAAPPLKLRFRLRSGREVISIPLLLFFHLTRHIFRGETKSIWLDPGEDPIKLGQTSGTSRGLPSSPVPSPG